MLVLMLAVALLYLRLYLCLLVLMLAVALLYLRLYLCTGFNDGCSPTVLKAVFMCAGVNFGCGSACVRTCFSYPDEGGFSARRNVRIATTGDTGVRNCASRRCVHARTHMQFPLRDKPYQTRLRSDSFGAGEVCRLRNSTLGRYEHTNRKKMYGSMTLPG